MYSNRNVFYSIIINSGELEIYKKTTREEIRLIHLHLRKPDLSL